MYTKEEEVNLRKLAQKIINPVNTIFKEEVSDRVNDLRKVIEYLEWRYSVKNDPLFGDTQYDQFYRQLETLEDQFRELITPNSPTQRVSSDIMSDFKQVSHLTPMLSLSNSYDSYDLNTFDRQVKKLCGLLEDTNVEYSVEPKFDGGTIAMIYENDRLVRAATRGNGEFGDDITNNMRTLISVPLTAKFSEYNIYKAELRGEVLIRKEYFEKMNKGRKDLGEQVFANPRNAATGALRMKDPKEVATRGLEVFFYQLGYAIDNQGNSVMEKFANHDESIHFLHKLGFKVPQHKPESDNHLQESKVCQNINEVVKFCQDWQEYREEYPYEIDGMVIKVNRLDLQKKCGYTDHHPRWAIAFKFRAQQGTTKILGIEFQVGKTGAITPIARLAPVRIAGVKVSNVSLHNEDFIIKRDIRERDSVLVERSGDVIPYVVKVFPELRDGNERKFKFPEKCPVCHSKLVKLEEEAVWRCENAECEAQVLQRMIFHTSKHAMDIEGLGESTIERFFKLGWLRSIADMYRLDYEAIAQLEGFGEKSATNLRAAIEKAKQNPIYRLLHSLSIHHLGQKGSKLIAAEIAHVLDLKDWDLEKYQTIKDVGPVLAKNVFHFFQNEHNIELLQTMEQLGVNLQQTEADKRPDAPTEGPLLGRSILFTGTLSQMTREEAEKRAIAAGANIASGVSKHLSILVVGEKAGSKLKKAQALETVEIWSEVEFLEKILD